MPSATVRSRLPFRALVFYGLRVTTGRLRSLGLRFVVLVLNAVENFFGEVHSCEQQRLLIWRSSPPRKLLSLRGRRRRRGLLPRSPAAAQPSTPHAFPGVNSAAAARPGSNEHPPAHKHLTQSHRAGFQRAGHENVMSSSSLRRSPDAACVHVRILSLRIEPA